METILIVANVILACNFNFLVLLQRSEGGALGLRFVSKIILHLQNSWKFFNKINCNVIATLFIISSICLLLYYLEGIYKDTQSVLEKIEEEKRFKNT